MGDVTTLDERATTFVVAFGHNPGSAARELLAQDSLWAFAAPVSISQTQKQRLSQLSVFLAKLYHDLHAYSQGCAQLAHVQPSFWNVQQMMVVLEAETTLCRPQVTQPWDGLAIATTSWITRLYQWQQQLLTNRRQADLTQFIRGLLERLVDPGL